MENVPEYYVDIMQMGLIEGSATIKLGINDPPGIGYRGPNNQKELVVLRTNLNFAKVLTMILRKTLKEHERNTGCPILVSAPVMRQLGLAPEDW